MFKKYTVGLCAVVALALAVPAAPTQAQTDDMAAMLATIQLLLERVQELQAQLAAMRGELSQVRTELREEIRTALNEGMSGEEVRRVQQLLATDPDIYPEGLVTGFYGGMTRQAVMRLQQRHKLPATGSLDEATRELINQYFTERDGQVPPGLLRAPGIAKAVEQGICKRGAGDRPFCPATDKPVDDKKVADKQPEDKKDTKPKTEVSEEKARSAVQGAQRAIEVVRAAVREAGRGPDLTKTREYLMKAEDTYTQARRAYNAEEYASAYEWAVESRRLSNVALRAIPDSAIRTSALRDQVQAITRDYEPKSTDDKKDQPKKDEHTQDDILRTCGLDKFKDLVGQRLNDRAAVIARWEEYHKERAGTRSVRFINPGDAVTMDYIETRLNVYLDRNRVVEKVLCG